MLKKLMEQRAELQKSLDAVLSAAKTEERAMNAEETAEFDRIESEIKAIDTTIKAEERARNIGSIQIPEVKTKEEMDTTKKFRLYLLSARIGGTSILDLLDLSFMFPYLGAF